MDCFVASAPRNDGPCSPGGAKRSPRLSLPDVTDCAEPVIGRRFRPLAGHGDFLLNLTRLIVIGFALNPCNIPSSLEPIRPTGAATPSSPIFLRQFPSAAALCCAGRGH